MEIRNRALFPTEKLKVYPETWLRMFGQFAWPPKKHFVLEHGVALVRGRCLLLLTPVLASQIAGAAGGLGQ